MRLKICENLSTTGHIQKYTGSYKKLYLKFNKFFSLWSKAVLRKNITS